MKYLFLFLVSAICFVSYGQSKGDSKIIAAVSDTVNVFNRIALFLVQRGYTIETKDSELGYISTQPKKLSKWLPEVKVNAVISGNKITLSGFGDTGGLLTPNGLKSTGTFDPITYTGKNNFMRDCWNELVAIGKELGQLSFAK